MISKYIVAAVIAGFSSTVIAQDAGPANFITKESYISFWQKDIGFAGRGICVAELAFRGLGLMAPIENLNITIRVRAKNGEDFGVGRILINKIGEEPPTGYQLASFDGQEILKLAEMTNDAGASPLCWEGTTLVIEGATGTQSGKTVDLFKHKQIRYTPRQLLNIEIK